MKSFKEIATPPEMGVTANGMPTFSASGRALVDLFSAIGSSRGKDLSKQFSAAYAEDRVKALKILLWARDIRGGSGERQTFRNLLVQLETLSSSDAEMLIPYIPFFGRWDDLLVFNTKALREAAYSVIAEGLNDPTTSGLAAKWMPRKGKIALELEEFLGLQPISQNFKYSEKAYPAKKYRALLTSLSITVEQKMCAKEWDDINFEHVPSVAAARYTKAFNRHCSDRYTAYKNRLTTGSAKINAAAIYPYDVIKTIDSGNKIIAKAQWESLPDYIGNHAILAVVDVSGSMMSKAGKSNVSNLQVACSLGLYVADKNKGPFKDVFVTFSSTPKIEVLKGDILAKYKQMASSHWEMGTNLMAAMMEILSLGKRYSVDDADMPKTLLILSDMEFNACVSGADKRAMVAIREMYAEAEYTLPNVVFWNLSAREGNTPVRFDERGTALVSGFSPAIMKSILAAQEIKSEKFTPESVMEKTISNDRYDVIDAAVVKQSLTTATKEQMTVKVPTKENQFL